MIDVFFFLPQLGGGGAEMNAVRLAAGLVRHGVCPTYVVARGPGSYVEHLPREIKVILLETGSIDSSTLRLVRSVRPLVRLINTCRPDVVCPVLPIPALTMLAAVSRCSYKPKVALSIQNTLEPPHLSGLGFMDRLQNLLIRRAFPQADRVIALSRGVAGDVARAVPELADNIDVVPNVGVPLESQLALCSQNRPKHTIRSRASFRFLACGRLVEQKGYPFLLEAFATLEAESDVYLEILGDGPLRLELEALARSLGIEERVSFLGFQRDPFTYMKEADVFVLSSLWEGFGNVIVEAMTMGTPVISTDCPHGPNEIIMDGKSGLLVPPGNAKALASAMQRLMDDENLRARLAENALTRAAEFSLDHIAKCYANVFFNLVSGNDRTTARSAG